MDFRKYKLTLICLTGFFLMSPSVVFAGADSGFYIGLGVGDTTIKTSKIDTSEASSKFFGGYNFGLVPFMDIAVEASYIGFGKASEILSGFENSYDISAVTGYCVAGLSFGMFGIFAKAGVINWSSDIVRDNVKSSDSGSDAAYGVGARLQINSLSVRAEYEVFDISGVDTLDMLSLSAAYTF